MSTVRLRLGSPVPEIVRGDELESMRDAWSALWRCCPEATPFQAPGWIIPWARRYAAGRCRASALRRGRRLVALLPAFTWQGTLLLAGTGPSDYGDGLFLPGAETCAALLLSSLAEELPHGGVDRIDLRQLRPKSPLLDAAAPEGWTCSSEDGTVCPVLRLSGPQGMAAVSGGWRSNWRYAVRRIARDGGAIEGVPAEEVPDSVAALEQLHEMRWSGCGEAGAFRSDPLLSGFLREAAPELAASGVLRMHRIRFGERIAAVLLAMSAHGEVHYYLSGFDPAYSACSPGTALVGAAIAAAAEEGAREFHFLRGREAYKYRWGAEDRPTRRRLLARDGAPGRPYPARPSGDGLSPPT